MSSKLFFRKTFKSTSKSQSKVITVQLLEIVNVSAGEVTEAPEKAYSLMTQHEMKMRRPGHPSIRPKNLDDYVGF